MTVNAVQPAGRARKKYRMSRLERKNTLIAYSFLAPNFIGFAIFTLIPVVLSVVMSFTEWKGGDLASMQWVGLDNYASIFNSAKVGSKMAELGFFGGLDYFFSKVDLGIALKNTVFFTIVTVPLSLICAILLALVLNKAVRGAVVFRAIYFFPYVASMVAICVCWNFMLMKNGPINQLLMALGINFNKSWTADSTMAMWAIILVSVWRNMGYYMVIYLAALQGIPRELYEAAMVDGAGPLRRFFRITVPLISPTTFYLLVVRLIAAFRAFSALNIMGVSKTAPSLVTEIYSNAFDSYKFGYASAEAWVLVAVILVITLIQMVGQKKWVHY